MLTLFLRAVFLDLFVLLILRLTGKRQVSDLQPYDLLMTLIIADLASTAIADTDIPLLYMAIGTEDDLLENNREFRDFLVKEGAELIYEEGPGIHDWFFWNEYLDKGLGKVLAKLK